jgi:hypothetical protein
MTLAAARCASLHHVQLASAMQCTHSCIYSSVPTLQWQGVAVVCDAELFRCARVLRTTETERQERMGCLSLAVPIHGQIEALAALQELQRRYQDFRQYAATAHDQGDGASLAKLARRFAKDARREAMQQEAAAAAGGGGAEAVPGADFTFESLVASCRRCARLRCGVA